MWGLYILIKYVSYLRHHFNLLSFKQHSVCLMAQTSIINMLTPAPSEFSLATKRRLCTVTAHLMVGHYTGRHIID